MNERVIRVGRGILRGTYKLNSELERVYAAELHDLLVEARFVFHPILQAPRGGLRSDLGGTY